MPKRIEPFDTFAEMLKEDSLMHFYHELYTILHLTAWTTGSEFYGEMGLVLKKIYNKHQKELNEKMLEKLSECISVVKKVWPKIMES